MTNNIKYTEGHIQRLLAERYCAPEWAYFSGVPNCTGGGTRIADGVAMNLYPSKGLALTCFEIKVSRSDLMAELKDITKSECIGKYCEYFVLVVPAGIVSTRELPDHWGLLEVKDDSLRSFRKPKKQENVAPLDRGFVASLLRRASERSEDMQMIKSLSIKEKEIEDKIRRYENTIKSQSEFLDDKKNKLNEKIKQFEAREKMFQEATGLFPQEYYRAENHLIPAFLKAASKEGMFGKIEKAHTGIVELQTILGEIVTEFKGIEKEEDES
jgi:hypothetical protein